MLNQSRVRVKKKKKSLFLVVAIRVCSKKKVARTKQVFNVIYQALNPFSCQLQIIGLDVIDFDLESSTRLVKGNYI